MIWLIAVMLLPDPKLTPGDWDKTVTAQQACVPGFAKHRRHVTLAQRKLIFKNYHLLYIRGKYELDHLVSLELGGTNSNLNLWPQAYAPKPGAREKDWVEDDLHRRVCSGEISLTEAQRIIRTDWLSYYRSKQ